MALQPFDLAALTELDGCRIRTAFDLALARLTEDCKDRPAVKARRSVTLTGCSSSSCRLRQPAPKASSAPTTVPASAHNQGTRV